MAVHAVASFLHLGREGQWFSMHQVVSIQQAVHMWTVSYRFLLLPKASNAGHVVMACEDRQRSSSQSAPNHLHAVAVVSVLVDHLVAHCLV